MTKVVSHATSLPKSSFAPTKLSVPKSAAVSITETNVSLGGSNLSFEKSLGLSSSSSFFDYTSKLDLATDAFKALEIPVISPKKYLRYSELKIPEPSSSHRVVESATEPFILETGEHFSISGSDFSIDKMYFHVGETLPVFDGGANSSLMVTGTPFLSDESLFYNPTHQSWTWGRGTSFKGTTSWNNSKKGNGGRINWTQYLDDVIDLLDIISDDDDDELQLLQFQSDSTFNAQFHPGNYNFNSQASLFNPAFFPPMPEFKIPVFVPITFPPVDEGKESIEE